MTRTYPQGKFLVPPDSVDLFLVRHGQSADYVEGTSFPLVEGQGDPPLSALGQQQALQVCARLASADLDAIYVTSLRRTAQTAAPLAAALGLVPQVEGGLREVNLGIWEGGLYRKMVHDGHPIAQKVFAEQRWDVIPGAEPDEAFTSRVRAAIETLAAKHAGQRVAVFTHGGVIGRILALASASRAFAFARSENASISRVVVTEDAWAVRTYNDTSHLD
ncbi:MAG TPA: histidine phosphatase family protein [Streptosporangiaceae bacterium]|nr:histidine phosphatase family protein [Streptosporangiaceae bacterium]